MKAILANNHNWIHTRRALECYIEPILLYRMEAWIVSNQVKKNKTKKLEAKKI